MRAGIIGGGTGVVGMLLAAAPAMAQSTGQEPAGGAALGEAIGATAGALVATALHSGVIGRRELAELR